MASSVDPQQTQHEGSAPDFDLEAREKRAVKKERLVALTSGAKERLDKTIVGMKGAGHIIRHPFSKDARDEAKERTIEEKDKVGIKQASIRVAGHQNVLQEKATAAGVREKTRKEQRTACEDNADAPMADTQGDDLADSGEKPEERSPSSSSSDSSSRRRAQMPPDSEDYRSG